MCVFSVLVFKFCHLPTSLFFMFAGQYVNVSDLEILRPILCEEREREKRERERERERERDIFTIFLNVK